MADPITAAAVRQELLKLPDVLDADIIRGIEVANLLYGCHPLSMLANAALIAAELHHLRQSLSGSRETISVESDYDDITRRRMERAV